MNRKEIFKKVEAHLLAQGEKSLGYGRGCMYRGGNGLKCAIGVLITDECYEPELEGRSADASNVIAALECSGIEVGPGDGYFLRRLQAVHDANTPSVWPQVLTQVAEDYDL